MLLPECPVDLTVDTLIIDSVVELEDASRKVEYHCNACGYKNVLIFEPVPAA